MKSPISRELQGERKRKLKTKVQIDKDMDGDTLKLFFVCILQMSNLPKKKICIFIL